MGIPALYGGSAADPQLLPYSPTAPVPHVCRAVPPLHPPLFFQH